MLKILLKFKDKELKTLETEKTEISIGRNENNDIHINNLGASKKHARIFKRRGEYIIEDLNSTNGTLMNDESILTAKLKSNDIVTIGKHNLYISLQDGQDEAATGFAETTILIKR